MWETLAFVNIHSIEKYQKQMKGNHLETYENSLIIRSVFVLRSQSADLFSDWSTWQLTQLYLG